MARAAISDYSRRELSQTNNQPFVHRGIPERPSYLCRASGSVFPATPGPTPADLAHVAPLASGCTISPARPRANRAAMPGHDQVQNLVTHGVALARGKSRNKHLALLNGLLYCDSCGTRMVYSYSGKKDRKYPYYVCLNAQRKGWAVCPGKSLPAGAIEESVLERIRETQPGSLDPSEWEQMDRTRQVEAIQAIVERIGYDGTARQISIRFHPPAITAAGQEVRA